MFQDVDRLSSDGSDSLGGAPVAAAKRATNAKRERSKPKRKPLSLEQSLRCALGKACKCKQGCMAVFSQPEHFSKLQEFRKNWETLHKLDQDQVATYLRSCMECSCGRAS